MGVDAGRYMYDVVVKKFTLAISSSDEFLVNISAGRVQGPVQSLQTTAV